jgi:[acyl-carrier-protein] S-malonyltransferase
LVISGTKTGVEKATVFLKEAGAKRVLPLNVAGAFHSPLMLPAQKQLEEAIANTIFNEPVCPVYQNFNAQPVHNATEIKNNLIKQLTAPVRWTQTIRNMHQNRITHFVETGPGTVLQGLVKKIVPNAQVSAF